MKNNTVKTLGELELRELVDLGLRMPDGSTELFEVVNITDGCVTVMTKNIIDFMPFNEGESEHSGNANSYAESSIRKYLADIYQSVAKENGLLESCTLGSKEFFLPPVSAMNFGEEEGWQAFKNDSSRIKYTGTFSSTKAEANGLGESDWYWTGTTHTTYTNLVHYVRADGTHQFNFSCNSGVGVVPALNLRTTAPVVLIEGVWSLCDSGFETLGDKNHSIKIGDWIEVTHTAEIDIQEGILLGDCFEVVGFGAQGEVNITLSSDKSWYLPTDQVRKIKPPLTRHKKTQEPPEHDERLKGYYQHTAIETLKLYHTVHKVKEERIKALNKALENIQELIKLERHN